MTCLPSVFFLMTIPSEARPLRFSLLEARLVPCFTFECILQMSNADGCEILCVDAEGADCEILRSMCRAGGGWGDLLAHRSPWPRVVMFETRGLADKGKHPWLEDRTLRMLQDYGYLVVVRGGDSILLYGPALQCSTEFARWADEHFVTSCSVCSWQAWPSSVAFEMGTGRCYSKWAHGKWTCEWCRRGRPTWMD